MAPLLQQAILDIKRIDEFQKFMLAMGNARHQLEHARLCNSAASATPCVQEAVESFKHAAMQLNTLAASLEQALKESST